MLLSAVPVRLRGETGERSATLQNTIMAEVKRLDGGREDEQIETADDFNSSVKQWQSA